MTYYFFQKQITILLHSSLTEIVTVLVLGLLIFDIGPSADSLWFDEITLRLFSIYALQIAARGYVFSQRNAWIKQLWNLSVFFYAKWKSIMHSSWMLYCGAVLRFLVSSKQSPWYTGGSWAGCLRRLGRRWRLSPSGQWLPPSTLMRAEAQCGLEKPRPPQGKCPLEAR